MSRRRYYIDRLQAVASGRSRLRSMMACLAIMMLGFPVSAAAQILPSFGEDRAGTSGFQFLKIPVDARSAALGESVVANGSDASSVQWNPALAAQTQRLQLGANHTAYFTDINLEYASLVYRLPGSSISLGASVQALNSGDMEVTTEFQPFGTGENFRFTDLAVGVTFAQNLTDLFSYGVTSKYVRESVAGVSTNTVLFDLGIFYQVGETGAQMGVAIRNFGLDGKPSGEIDRIVVGQEAPVVETDFESITAPTTFLLGFAYSFFRNTPENDLVLALQLNNPADNVENWNVGLEYTWREVLILRGGYRFGIEEYVYPSAGLGLVAPIVGSDLRFDYGFSSLDRLGSVHRVGINLSF